MILPQPLLRAVAVACLLYLGLASCRALLPGLCANLPAGPQTAEAVYGGNGDLRAKRPCCCASSAPYCAPDTRNSSGPGTSIPRLADCAFCKITAVPGESLAQAELPLPVSGGFAPFLLRDVEYARQNLHMASPGRAPPRLAFC